LGGLHLRFLSSTVIAIAGAEVWAQINGQNLANFTAVPVKAGDILTLSFARQGARSYIGLRGNKLEVSTSAAGPHHMTSSPLLPGTLQLPPDGQPILALVDGHCTGGYPRCLQIIRADLWQLGQIGPGSRVSFRRCFDGEAAAALSRRNEFYGGLMTGFSF